MESGGGGRQEGLRKRQRRVRLQAVQPPTPQPKNRKRHRAASLFSLIYRGAMVDALILLIRSLKITTLDPFLPIGGVWAVF